MRTPLNQDDGRRACCSQSFSYCSVFEPHRNRGHGLPLLKTWFLGLGVRTGLASWLMIGPWAGYVATLPPAKGDRWLLWGSDQTVLVPAPAQTRAGSRATPRCRHAAWMHVQHLRFQASYLTSLCLTLLIRVSSKMRIGLYRAIGRIYWVANHLAQCLAHSKPSVSVSL